LQGCLQADFEQGEKMTFPRFLSWTVLVALIVGMAWLAVGCANGSNYRANAGDTRETLSVTGPATAEALQTPALRLYGPPRAPEALVWTKTTRDRSTGAQPPTGRQIFGLWVGKFSAVALILMVVFFVLFPGTALAFFVKKFFAVRAALRETVAGVQLSGAIDNHPTLKASLKAAQSQRTRELVQQAKAVI
jgi:hypothetical protein